MKGKREALQKHVDREQAVCKEHATLTAQEEAERREGTQAQAKEPAIAKNQPQADPVQDTVRANPWAAATCDF